MGVKPVGTKSQVCPKKFWTAPLSSDENEEDNEESVGSHTSSSKRFKTSVFPKKVHPLSLHMTTFTVGTSTRLIEVGIASFLQPDRCLSLQLN